MNIKLYNYLVKKFEDENSVTQYNKHKNWVINHITKISTEFEFLKIGTPIKYKIGDVYRISKLEDFIIDPYGFIGVDTGFGILWYYEIENPTKIEVDKFDGHCLVI